MPEQFAPSALGALITSFVDEGPRVRQRTQERELSEAQVRNIGSLIRERREGAVRAGRQIDIGERTVRLAEQEFEAEQLENAELSSAMGDFADALENPNVSPETAFARVPDRFKSHPAVRGVFTAALTNVRGLAGQAGTQDRFTAAQEESRLTEASRRADATDSEVSDKIEELRSARNTFRLSDPDQELRTMLDRGQEAEVRERLRTQINPNFREDDQARRQRESGQPAEARGPAPPSPNIPRVGVTTQEDLDNLIEDFMDPANEGLSFEDAVRAAQEQFDVSPELKNPTRTRFLQRPNVQRFRRRNR